MAIIFETERLTVRHLKSSDLAVFHKMQSNVEVLKYVTPKVLDFEGNKQELLQLIDRYSLPNNDFQIYAIERKTDEQFLGSVALVVTDGEDEIGYRLLPEYWGFGYATEVAKGLLNYCLQIGKDRIVAYVAYENEASIKIIEKLGFEYIEDNFAEDLQLLERKYELKL